jgi:hypothetical protein
LVDSVVAVLASGEQLLKVLQRWSVCFVVFPVLLAARGLACAQDKLLVLTGEVKGDQNKGGSLDVPAGTSLAVHVHAVAEKGSVIRLVWDGAETGSPQSLVADTTLTASAGRHWLRLEVQDAQGTNELISSPLYINFPKE